MSKRRDIDAHTWWRQNQFRTETALRRFIDDFDEIADTAIPYHWIPGRAETIYAGHFVTWDDISGETISSLLTWPKAGIGTVRALIIAARDAASLARTPAVDDTADAATVIARVLDKLDAYDRQLLRARRWTVHPLTIGQSATLLNVSEVNVERHTPRAYKRFQYLLAQPAHAALTDYALELSERLGPLTELSTAEQALTALDLDPAGDSGRMLLHVAGPYMPTGPWLQRADTDAVTQAQERIAEAFSGRDTQATHELTAELGHLGIPAPTAQQFLRTRSGLRRFADLWVPWGPTIADKAEAVLHISAAPASADLIAATMGPDFYPHVVRHVLFNDSRFSRTTKQLWALRQWGLKEYSGIFTEFTTRIQNKGGSHSVKALIRDMKLTYPDVSEKSLVSYLSAPAFIVDNGHVRMRSEADGWPPVSPPQTIRGVYFHGDNQIRLAVAVDEDLLRGSGQTIHPAVATTLGVQPGQERVFTGTPESLTLFWRVSATNGASVGSLRALAGQLKSRLGDTIVLAFNRQHGTVEALPCSATREPLQRLAVLLGHADGAPADGLALALTCPRDQVVNLLQRRGDHELAALIDGAAL